MRRLVPLIILVLFLNIPVAAEGPSGSVLAIGGGKLPDDVLERIVALASKRGPLLVCPAASERVEGPEVELFKARGGTVELLDFRTREEADDPARVARLEAMGGIFFTGGDQKRLLGVLRGSKALDAIKRAWREGALVSGTSAGCAALGELAIVRDGESDRIKAGATPLDEGLGFLPGIVDQHFLARRRHNRLVSALLEKKGKLGLGVDEGVALLRRGAGPLEVVGKGFVSLYVPSKEDRRFELRLLEAGDRFEVTGK